jgi:hypothetical protein
MSTADLTPKRPIETVIVEDQRARTELPATVDPGMATLRNRVVATHTTFVAQLGILAWLDLLRRRVVPVPAEEIVGVIAANDDDARTVVGQARGLSETAGARRARGHYRLAGIEVLAALERSQANLPVSDHDHVGERGP